MLIVRWLSATLFAVAILLAGSLAPAQESYSSGSLQGGVQESVPASGDQFNSGSNGPSTTNQPGVGGSPYCRQRDPECGGTDRRCYDAAYNSKAIVLSVQESQNLYQRTNGGIWIRCGACGGGTLTKVICWPRPGYEELFSANPTNTPSSGQPGGMGGPSSSAVPNVVDAGYEAAAKRCDRVLQQQGNWNNFPSCGEGGQGSVLDWCRQFQEQHPECIAIVAQAQGTNTPPQPSRAANRMPLPIYVPVPSSPSSGGNPTSNNSSGDNPISSNSDNTPLKPGVAVIDPWGPNITAIGPNLLDVTDPGTGKHFEFPISKTVTENGQSQTGKIDPKRITYRAPWPGGFSASAIYVDNLNHPLFIVTGKLVIPSKAQ
jgi:hypothetical protein